MFKSFLLWVSITGVLLGTLGAYKAFQGLRTTPLEITGFYFMASAVALTLIAMGAVGIYYSVKEMKNKKAGGGK